MRLSENGIEAIFCDQNYQFAELAALRARGVRTIGRFVWEHFTADHAAGARQAYDLVFSLTRAEQDQHAGMGIESPYVRWGCHPELLAVAEDRGRAGTGHRHLHVFRSGFLGHRKPVEPVLEAFMATADPRLRLVVKAQVERAQVRPAAEAVRARSADRLVGDQPTRAHLREVAACDVCVSPGALGGPRVAPLRGDRLQDAVDHERCAADGAGRQR